MPGVVYVDHGARHDPIIPGKVDRGGAINTIAPNGITSKNACGQATSGYLVEVQKVTETRWKSGAENDPEAFEASRENTTRRPACASTPGLKEAWNK